MKYKDILEYKKGKEARTHIGVVYAGRDTDWLSDGEEGSKFKRVWELTIFLNNVDW